jgi:hypothetical protein
MFNVGKHVYANDNPSGGRECYMQYWHKCLIDIFIAHTYVGYAVVRFDEALYYKPEGLGFYPDGVIGNFH